MKTKVYISIFLSFFFTLNIINAQTCLPGGINFTSQSEIDDFPINYPGCTEILGDVVIDDVVLNDIKNVDGLAQVTSIGGYLDIKGNNKFTSLSGLSQLTSVGGYLRLWALNNLSNFNGLDKLTSVGGELIIRNNNFVTSLSGLEPLTSVDKITFHANPLLSDLSALSGITQLNGFLHIASNSSLSDFSGLHNITSVGGYVRIAKNHGISTLAGLEGLTSIGEYLQVDQNDNLLNLNGLGQLNSLGDKLHIEDNIVMTDLAGLPQLTTVGGWLGVYNCPALEDLNGWSGITTVGTNLNIFGNDLIVNLNGLENLTTINGHIHVAENDALTTLSGIDNIDPNGITDLFIQNSNVLSTCNVQSICDYLSVPANPATISGNILGCDSRAEVEAGCAVLSHFITTWKTDNPGTSNSTSITIPTAGGGYLYDVDWENDGTFDDFGVTGNITHDYGAIGTYSVAIKGTFPRIYFNDGGDKEKILSIDQWGDIEWSSMVRAFRGANNLIYNAIDSPDLSNVTSLLEMFRSASSFNGDLSTWDVSNITNMSSMFLFASTFNGDISAWDVSNVTTMYQMFYAANSFNTDLSTWDVSSVTDMTSMFFGANSFNQDLSSWDVSNVTTMFRMFWNANVFNADISSWNVSNVTNMSGMFSNANAFNADISGWDVSSVTNMSGMFQLAGLFASDLSSWDVSSVINMGSMFYSANAFNEDISSWDVSSVTNMSFMFYSAISFNGDLNSWDVSSVTTMASMFGAASVFAGDLSAWDVSSVTNMSGMFYVVTSFNSDISGWDVSSLENMGLMFYSASSFNTDISGWDVSSVTTMAQVFRYASAFNQDLSSWDVSNVTSMASMFYLATSFDQDLGAWNITSVGNINSMQDMLYLSGLSVTNYDNTLIGWAGQAVQSGVSLGANGLVYCLGESARNTLINTYGWTITGDALLGTDGDGDGFTACQGDCDDNDPNNYPGNTEICDGQDNNCDGYVDEGFDQDGDGFTSCGGDCDDNDPNNYPGNAEVCDGQDNNCDNIVDLPGCTGLSAHFDFSDDPGGGIVTDISGNSNHGSIVFSGSNSLIQTSDACGGDAYQFSTDENTHIIIPVNVSQGVLYNEITIAVSFNIDPNISYPATGKWKTLCDIRDDAGGPPLGNRIGIWVDMENLELHAEVKKNGNPNSFILTSGNIIPGQWQQAIFVVRNSSPSMELYLDCQSVATSNINPLPFTFTNEDFWTIGTHNNFGNTLSHYMIGEIGDVRIYDYEFNAQELEEICLENCINTVTCFLDSDGDGFGDVSLTQTFFASCGTGYVTDDADCDDNNPLVNPNATETCDGQDNNCDGEVDEGFDEDNDGIADCFDICPGGDDNIDGDGDGTPDFCDICPGGDDNIDSDSDGTPDYCDECPGDENKITMGICGCGVSDVDTDSDGTADCDDECPNDENKIAEGICGCGVSDEGDNDLDGFPNECDNCLEIPNTAQLDSDEDGIGDTCDACPDNNDHGDYDEDGYPDCADCGNNKILICHVPPGNPCNEKQLCLPESAVNAHIVGGGNGHGTCYVGTCIMLYCNNGSRLGQSSSQKQDILLSPNPVLKELNLRFIAKQDSKVIIQVADISGHTKILQHQDVNAGLRIIQLDVADLHNGIYFISVQVGQDNYAKKFVKMDDM